ncbi:MAG: hypothetical protein CMJ81_02050 [Planctomycetaceae bacterium]|nr:hypothetical protein [Planctomycetaceae bacterium]
MIYKFSSYLPHCSITVVVLTLVFTVGTPNRLPGSDRIDVKLFVDEEEPYVPQRWQQRLRKRLLRASKIMEPYTSLPFRISGFRVWQSDDQTTEFTASLQEFEKEASVGRNEIAVAFTSQYRLVAGRYRMGGTRGPLHSHILIRENNPQASEAVRLELLIHELGHHLGAAHSSQLHSAMRPTLGDFHAGSQRLQFGFDSWNARIIRLVAGEIRFLNVKQFGQLSVKTKRQLREYYTVLAGQLPEDPAAKYYLKLLQ